MTDYGTRGPFKLAFVSDDICYRPYGKFSWWIVDKDGERALNVGFDGDFACYVVQCLNREQQLFYQPRMAEMQTRRP